MRVESYRQRRHMRNSYKVCLPLADLVVFVELDQPAVMVDVWVSVLLLDTQL